MRQINEAGKQETREAEGLRLKAYLDSAGVPTIGYGHTKGVRMGDRCTLQQAEAWLDEDLDTAELCVARKVKVPLTDNQFAALVVFVFNVGVNAFATSTLLRVLNQGRYDLVPDQMRRWNKVTIPGTKKKRVEPGLNNRRNREIALWLRGSAPANAYGESVPLARPVAPPAPTGVLGTSTGKAQAAALVSGGAGAVAELAPSFGDTLREMLDQLTGLAWAFDFAKYLLIIGTLALIGWTLWDRRKKLKEQGY